MLEALAGIGDVADDIQALRADVAKLVGSYPGAAAQAAPARVRHQHRTPPSDRRDPAACRSGSPGQLNCDGVARLPLARVLHHGAGLGVLEPARRNP